MIKCSKIAFHSKSEANKYLSHINARKKSVKRMTSYQCMSCHLWHLTSQSKAQTRRRKRYNNKCDKQYQMIIDFKNLANNSERWKWLIKNQADWMVLHIDDHRTYLVFNDNCRVIFG